ncbi:hypothetical protein [Bacillus alkalisoli]|uniref:hypothetical protein n=1 Tax=Bacillus alkalisoli TaxID=2011008 RepID=UPI000C23E5ED|nr:hypothetical protein [Bacillus alkalisoli]
MTEDRSKVTGTSKEVTEDNARMTGRSPKMTETRRKVPKLQSNLLHQFVYPLAWSLGFADKLPEIADRTPISPITAPNRR